MKRLVLCFDGTWNALADPTALTNVVKLANLVTVSRDNVEQVSYYNSGVGSGGFIDRYLGGIFGVGLKSNVKRGLTFLALNYEEKDEIYIFGFSRGAYTARALAGVIGSAGIPVDISNVETHWDIYQQMAKLRPDHRLAEDAPKRKQAEAAIELLRQKLVKVSRNTNEDETKLVDVPLACVGVWDTVGAYGIPSGFGLSSLGRSFTYWTRGFRDTHFGTAVKLGLHAVAIDERRRPFVPTFWTLRPPKPEEKVEGTPPKLPVEQVWFPGVHSNVGGGYADRGLSDLALAWMMAEVQERTALRFNESEAMGMVWPCSAATLYHSSKRNWLNPARAVLPPMPKTTGFGARIMQMLGFRRRRFQRVNERLHWSVHERCRWGSTLVDNGDPCKYTPGNVSPSAKRFTRPLALEVMLSDHSLREWGERCPMKKLNKSCECKARDFHALSVAAAAGETSAAA